MKRVLMTAIAGACISTAAQAHHSFAMFDLSQYKTLDGTVVKFEWTNPHVWLWVAAKDDSGTLQTWGLENGAPVQLKAGGLKYDSFKPGDHVKVTLHPMKDNKAGGQMVEAVLADGTIYKGHDSAKDNFPGGPGGPGPGTP